MFDCPVASCVECHLDDENLKREDTVGRSRKALNETLVRHRGRGRSLVARVWPSQLDESESDTLSTPIVNAYLS